MAGARAALPATLGYNAAKGVGRGRDKGKAPARSEKEARVGRNRLLGSARRSLFVLVGLSAGSQPAWAEEAFAPLGAADQERVERGDILVQVEKTPDALKSFRAVGQIKAPAERVFAAFTDFEHYAAIFHLKESKVLSRQGSRLFVRAVLGMPWPVGDRWVTNETTLAPESNSFAYQRREGSILRYEGTLRVVSKGPSLSQVYYTAKGDPGIPLLPSWLLNQFQAKLLPDSIQRIRDYVAR